MKTKREKRIKRKLSLRKKVMGSALKPRLNIHRSNKYLFAQLIDDENNKTIVGLSDKKLNLKGKKIEVSEKLGKEFAKLVKVKKINEVVFDRSGYKYHGRIKAFAEAAKAEGLKL